MLTRFFSTQKAILKSAHNRQIKHSAPVWLTHVWSPVRATVSWLVVPVKKRGERCLSCHLLYNVCANNRGRLTVSGRDALFFPALMWHTHFQKSILVLVFTHRICSQIGLFLCVDFALAYLHSCCREDALLTFMIMVQCEGLNIHPHMWFWLSTLIRLPPRSVWV